MSLLLELLRQRGHEAIADVVWLMKSNVLVLEKAIAPEPLPKPEPTPDPGPSPLPKPLPDTPPGPKPPEPVPAPLPSPVPELPNQKLVKGNRVRLSGVRALPEAREVLKALKFFRKQVRSTTRFDFDEHATVEYSAEVGVATPMLAPKRERWLELALLVDQTSGMELWRDALRELHRLCERAGVFSDVRIWRLDPVRARLHGRDRLNCHGIRELMHGDG